MNLPKTTPQILVLLVYIAVGGLSIGYIHSKHETEQESLSGIIQSKIKIDPRNESVDYSTPSWTIQHAFNSACGCSKLIIRKLLEIGPQTKVHKSTEEVIWISTEETVSEAERDLTIKLTQRGFKVRRESNEATIDSHPEWNTLPLLKILHNGRPHYIGAYTKGLMNPFKKIIYPEILTTQAQDSIAVKGCKKSKKTGAIL